MADDVLRIRVGLIGEHRQLQGALRQGVQQFRDAVVGLRFHLRMLLVVRLILRLHRVRQVLPVANRPLRQNLRAVADEVAVFLRLPAGQPVQAQSTVHRRGNVVNRVRQRTVQIKQNRLNHQKNLLYVMNGFRAALPC